MDAFRVSFFGHRQLNDPFRLEKALETLVFDLLQTKEYVEFLIGRDGEFDRMTASVIRRCKKSDSEKCVLTLVLPYLTAEYRDNEASFHTYYDEVEICTESAAVHFRAAHRTRNHAILERSDLAVFYVEHSSNGAYEALCYAKKKRIPHVNLAL